MVESVYSAVRTVSLYKADYVWSLERLNKAITDWFYSRGGKCLQRGTDCFLIQTRLRLFSRRLITPGLEETSGHNHRKMNGYREGDG